MSIGEQRANNLQSIGTEFENFLKQHPKDKRNGLKEICLKCGVDFNKVCRIFITN